MSTPSTIHVDPGFELTLVYDFNRTSLMVAPPTRENELVDCVIYESRNLTDDEVVEIAAKILGPMLYQAEKPSEVMQTFNKILTDRGYL